MNNVEKLISAMCGSDSTDEISSVDRFLGDDAIHLLCDKLKNNNLSNKRRLILRGNCVGMIGAKALSDLLKSNPSLKFISLEWNQIGSQGAKLLADALQSNQGLTHLDLRNNGINNEGAIALANSLQSNNLLQTLDLRWNQVRTAQTNIPTMQITYKLLFCRSKTTGRWHSSTRSSTATRRSTCS